MAPKVQSFLVFEADTNVMPVDQANRVKLIGYHPIGSARAESAEAACMAVMGVTRRIGKYAAVPATFLDFTPNLDPAESERLALNP
jgi:hypothetical protein